MIDAERLAEIEELLPLGHCYECGSDEWAYELMDEVRSLTARVKEAERWSFKLVDNMNQPKQATIFRVADLLSAAPKDADTEDRPVSLCEPLVNLTLVAELFPHRHPVTVARWNRGDTSTARGKRLPAPDVVVGGVELWKVETVLSWAAANHERVHPAVLDRILREQTA